MRQDHRDYLDGALAIAPLIPGCLPIGLVAGVISAEMNFSAATGIGQAFIIYAGTAQLAAIQFMTSDTMIVVAILTGLIVNLRLAMYSAAIAPHFKGLSTRYRMLSAYFLTDQSFAIGITRFTEAEICNEPMSVQAKFRFHLAAGVTMWAFWCSAVAVGFLVGAGLPSNWSLEFFVPLSFLALLMPNLRDRPSIVAAITGGSVAVVAHGLPLNLGLFVAALCGITAGYVWDARKGDEARSKEQ